MNPIQPFKVGYLEDKTPYWLSSYGSEYVTEDSANAAIFTQFEHAQPIMARETDLRWFMEMTIGNKVHRFFSQAEMMARQEPVDAIA